MMQRGILMAAFMSAPVLAGTPLDPLGVSSVFEVRRIGSDDSRLMMGKAVGTNGVTAVIGASWVTPWTDQPGVAFLHDLTTGAPIMTLMASDGTDRDAFGHAVDVCGSLAVIGAPGADFIGAQSGTAYIFDALTTFRERIGKDINYST